MAATAQRYFAARYFAPGFFGASGDPPRNIRDAIGQVMLDDSSVSDLAGTRVYFLSVPAKQSAASVAYQVISRDTPGDVSGPDASGTLIVQLSVIGADSSAVCGLADALRQLWDGFQGTPLGWHFQECIVGPERDGWTAPTNSSDRGTHRVTIDVTILYTEPS